MKQYSTESCSATGKFHSNFSGCYLMAMHQWRAPKCKVKNNNGICFQRKDKNLLVNCNKIILCNSKVIKELPALILLGVRCWSSITFIRVWAVKLRREMREMYCGVLFSKWCDMWYVPMLPLDPSTAIYKFKQYFVSVASSILLCRAELQLRVLTGIFGGRRTKSC